MQKNSFAKKKRSSKIQYLLRFHWKQTTSAQINAKLCAKCGNLRVFLPKIFQNYVICDRKTNAEIAQRLVHYNPIISLLTDK